MALTNKERQHRWRVKHGKIKGFGRAPAEISMRRLVKILEDYPLGLPVRQVYRKVAGQRQPDVWGFVWSACWYNKDGKTAPVEIIGTGKRGNPFTMRLSEEWDTARDWDSENKMKFDNPLALVGLI